MKGRREGAEQNPVGTLGFFCPKITTGDPRVFFSSCFSCTDRCFPLPLLMALITDRKPEPGKFHITEIHQPAQITILQRTKGYFVNPIEQVWLAFGRGFHSVVENFEPRLRKFNLSEDTIQALLHEHIIEQTCEAKIDTPAGPAVITGTPDIIIRSKKQIRDFKTVKTYKIKKMLKGLDWANDGYALQLNSYRTFFHPWVEELILDCLAKDWAKSVWEKGKYIPIDIAPIEAVQVPVFDPAYVRKFTEEKVGYLLACEKGLTQVRPCLNEEIWISKHGTPTRCAEYCSVATVCPQYQRWMGGGS